MATEPVAPVPSPAPAAPAPSPAPAARAPVPSGGISDAQYDRLDPGPEGQGKYARTRDAANNPQWVRRSDLPPDSDPVAPKPAAGDTPPATVTADNALKLGDLELSPSDVVTLLKQASENAIRQSQIPASATDYRATLPETFRLPQGVAFQFDEASPELGALREWAHGQHFTQQQFSEMLSFHAAAKGREDSAFAAAVQRERDALGAAATVRVDAVAQWIKGTLGEGHQDKAQALIRGLWSAKAVEALELLASKAITQGAANFSQAHRAPELPSGAGRVSDEQYSRMSQAERWEYARSHDQRQFYDPNRNNGR
jgi:hypothetical protein